MKLIPLTQGKFAKVDDADFDWLNKWKWCAIKNACGNWYAARSTPRDPVTYKQKFITMHRQIMGFPVGQVDHWDCDGLNNQRDNLRRANQTQQNHNRRKYHGKTSQYKGVTWRKNRGFWIASIRVDGVFVYLGSSHIEIEAARMYDAAAKKYFGEFARLNFPNE